MSEDLYNRLAEFLNNLPGGFPRTESGIELKILRKLFSPEQAEMELHMGKMPEPVAAIAKRAGMDEAKAAAMLEQMAREGCIYRLRTPNQPLYMAINFVVGIYEFHVGSMDRELAEMTEQYMPHFTKFWLNLKTKQLRVVPITKALDSNLTVAPYNDLRAMVKQQTIACNSPCICRKERTLLGHQCERPQDLCLQFGLGAQYFIENGIGKQITIDEALALLDKAEEAALVPQPTGNQELTNICCCCGCCCGVLLGLKKLPKPADHVMSAYRARIDSDECTVCGECVERCQMDAIKEDENFMEIDTDKCIGCGLCVPTCPSEAIHLVDKHMDAPPLNMVLMMIQMAKERGLA